MDHQSRGAPELFPLLTQLTVSLKRGPTICANLDWAHFDLLTDGLVKASGCEAERDS